MTTLCWHYTENYKDHRIVTVDAGEGDILLGVFTPDGEEVGFITAPHATGADAAYATARLWIDNRTTVAV